MSLIVLINFHFAAKCTIIRAEDEWNWKRNCRITKFIHQLISVYNFLGIFLSVKFGMFLINEKFIAFCDSPQNKKKFKSSNRLTAVEWMPVFGPVLFTVIFCIYNEPQYSMICCSFISQNAKCSQLFFLLRISRFPFSTVIWHFHGPCMHTYCGRIINYKSLYSLTN